MTLIWGIIGAGKISTQFVKAISILPNDDHKVLAVAAQNLERAKQFAAELNITKAYGNYKEIACDNEIDVVYIGNLNTQHLEVSKLMLSHGKHVLCEKPLTLNEAQTCELINFAKRKIQKELGGGTILDLGVYTLQLVQFVYKGLIPISITAQGTLNEQGVDESSSAIISYKDGKIAIVSTHSRIELPNEACVIGTKGMIKIPRFWCPDTIITPTETFHFELPKTDIVFRNPYTVGLCYEANEVRRCIKMGLLETPKITHSESLELAQWMDKIRADVGVIFDQDNV